VKDQVKVASLESAPFVGIFHSDRFLVTLFNTQGVETFFQKSSKKVYN